MNKMNQLNRLCTALALCFLSALSPAVMAQADAVGSADSTEPTDQWRFSVGLGAVHQPKYLGSKGTKVTPFPMFSAARGSYFIGAVPFTSIPMGVGAFLLKNETWSVGVGVGHPLQDLRQESDADELKGLGDIKAGAQGVVFAVYNNSWMRARGYVLTDLASKDQGTRIALDLDGKYQATPQLLLTAGPGITWMDDDYSQTFFGINAQQSRHAGRAIYHANSGVNLLRFNVAANYKIDTNWTLNARYSALKLRSDAEKSPLAEKNTHNVFSLTGTYRF